MQSVIKFLSEIHEYQDLVIEEKDKSTEYRQSLISYEKKVPGGSVKVKVCREIFLNILGVSKVRVRNIARHHLKTGDTAKEKRGGDRQTLKNEPKR